MMVWGETNPCSRSVGLNTRTRRGSAPLHSELKVRERCPAKLRRIAIGQIAGVDIGEVTLKETPPVQTAANLGGRLGLRTIAATMLRCCFEETWYIELPCVNPAFQDRR